MMGFNQSRRCNLRDVLDGAESPRRERKAVRSRRDWAWTLPRVSAESGSRGSSLFLSLDAFRIFPKRRFRLYAILSRRVALRVSW